MNAVTEQKAVTTTAPVIETPAPKEPMKIGIETVHFAAAIAAIKPFVNTRSQLPILSNVRLTQQTNRLAFHATDLDCSIVTHIDGTGSRGGGSTTAPVRQLADIIKGCNGDIHIESDPKDKISIVSGGLSSGLLGLPAEEYPAITKFRADRQEQITQGMLKTMLDRVRRCQSSDPTRYVINGVLLERKAGTVRVVATDGRRLALVEQETDIPDKDFQAIIPRDTIDKVFKLLGAGSGNTVTIEVEYDKEAFDKHVAEEAKAAAKTGRAVKPLKLEDEEATHIRFTFDAVVGKGAKQVTLPVVIVSRTIGGTYPNYRQVIPVDHLERIAIPRKELAERVAQLATNVRDDNQPSVKLTFTKKLLTVLTCNRELAESKSTIELKHVPKKEKVIAFNPGYLIDALQSVPEHETVYLEMVGELSPGVFKVDGERFTYVLMPMRPQ